MLHYMAVSISSTGWHFRPRHMVTAKTVATLTASSSQRMEELLTSGLCSLFWFLGQKTSTCPYVSLVVRTQTTALLPGAKFLQRWAPTSSRFEPS